MGINTSKLFNYDTKTADLVHLDVINLDTQFETYSLDKGKWITIRERSGGIIMKIILNQKGPDKQPHRWYSVEVPYYYNLDTKRVGDILFMNLKSLKYEPEVPSETSKMIQIFHHHNLSAIKLLAGF